MDENANSENNGACSEYLFMRGYNCAQAVGCALACLALVFAKIPDFHDTSDEARHPIQSLKAVAPLAEMFGYTTALRNLSQGRGTASMEFGYYAEVPKNIQDQIIYRITGRMPKE